MSDEGKRIVAGVLRLLESKQVPLQKVVLHKFMYFLEARGVHTGFYFEPYTYGPYSFDLAKTLTSMQFWDEIGSSKTEIEIQDLSGHSELDPSLSERISKHLAEFTSVVESFEFSNVECAGTVLYCAKALQDQGKPPHFKQVLKEFRAWKGQRYSDESIRQMYQRLEPFLA